MTGHLDRLNGPKDVPGSVAYAEETHRMALDLYDDAVPWRYLRWRRKMREVKRRQALHAVAMGWERE